MRIKLEKAQEVVSTVLLRVSTQYLVYTPRLRTHVEVRTYREQVIQNQ